MFHSAHKKWLPLILGLSLFWAEATGYSGMTTSEPAWTRHAVRLTGESDRVRQKALQKLRATRNLVAILRSELGGPRQPLALDVISALELEPLLPDLLKLAETDETAFVYLTINNLMTTQNKDDLVRIYRQRLLCGSRCDQNPAAQVVLLETLGRLHETVEKDRLEDLFAATESPEVRAAILDYARPLLLKNADSELKDLLKQALQSQPLQIREQALFLLSELPRNAQEEVGAEIPSCNNGHFGPTARRLCLRLKGQG